jgi:hypothetical protein
MDNTAIPEEIRRFVLTSVPSVPFLEALLLMRAAPEQPWSRDSLARRLYVRERVADALLADLCRAGMAAPWPGPDHGAGACADAQAYCYRPREDALRDRIDHLADLYATHLVEVTHLIHSSLDRKAHQFADAFKWRKDS